MTDPNFIHAFKNDIMGSYDATALSELIRLKKINPYELSKTAIERAKFVNPALNAIAYENFDNALKNSKSLPHMNGIFAGVPSFIKDTDEVAGMINFFGSEAVPKKQNKTSSSFVNQFLSTGVNILGITTMPEFGLTATTESNIYGDTLNPWNIDYSPGGSSGGSAALVAAGVVPIAHTNDGGGSTRIPAAACGLVGLKPTQHRLKTRDLPKILPFNIIHQGIVSRTVRDTANFMFGCEKNYLNKNFPKLNQILGPGSKKLRIGFFTKDANGNESHQDCKESVLNTAKKLEEIGHHVFEISNPYPLDIYDRFLRSYWALIPYYLDKLGYLEYGIKFNKNKFTPWANYLSSLVSLKHLLADFKALKKFSQSYDNIFSTFDVMLSPTVGTPAPKIGHLGVNIEPEKALERLTEYSSFTPIQNISGAPAISLPLGITKDNRPIGVQLMAPTGQDQILIELAFELEQAMPWSTIAEIYDVS